MSGVVTDAAGAPVARANVHLQQADGSDQVWVETAADGSYSVQVPVGSYNFSVDAHYGALTMHARGAVTVSADLVENTLPPLGALSVTVVDSAGSPVPETTLWVGQDPASSSTGATQGGTALTFTYGGGSEGTQCTTDAAGTCTLQEILGATDASFLVMPPHGLTQRITTTVPTNPTNFTVQLAGYGVVPSQGTAPGQVTVSVPAGLTLTGLSADPVQTAPAGAIALVGAMSYQVSGMVPGAATDVTLTLPAGSDPTSVYKVLDGVQTDVTSNATITGDTIVLHLVDGGWGDADGVANGVIVDPVIPAHLAPASDTTPPSVQISTHPTSLSSTRSAQFRFSGSDTDSPALSYRCSFDGATPTNCTSPVSASGLVDGLHTFAMTARDPAGNQSAPGTFSWRVDATAPAVTAKAPTTVFTLASSVTVAWSGSDAGSGIARYQLRYLRANFDAGFGSWQYPGTWSALTGPSVRVPITPGYDTCFSVRAIDKAGNLSAWTASRCTARPLDDRALSASTGWTRVRGPGYYLGTSTSTSREGATLTRTGVVLDRVGIIATRCPTCGVVGIYAGSRYIGKVNLYAARTQHQVLIELPRFTLRRATLTLKVFSSHKTIQVDGLATNRT